MGFPAGRCCPWWLHGHMGSSWAQAIDSWESTPGKCMLVLFFFASSDFFSRPWLEAAYFGLALHCCSYFHNCFLIKLSESLSLLQLHPQTQVGIRLFLQIRPVYKEVLMSMIHWNTHSKSNQQTALPLRTGKDDKSVKSEGVIQLFWGLATTGIAKMQPVKLLFLKEKVFFHGKLQLSQYRWWTAVISNPSWQKYVLDQR